MADAGSDQQSLEHAYSIINRESSFLNYLDLALQRIDDTSFGVCSKCGELISKRGLWKCLMQQSVLIVKPLMYSLA